MNNFLTEQQHSVQTPWPRYAEVRCHKPCPLLTYQQIVNGMSDNLLTSVIRAWDTDGSIDMQKKIIIVAPAMNSVAFFFLSTAAH
jgi:hypothetical protein